VFFMGKFHRIVLCLSVFAFVPSALLAQLTTATLTGTITDPTGAVVSGAKVTVVNVNTHFTAKAVSNASGDYRIDLLPIGSYTMTVESTGFKKFIQANITLSVNQQANVGAVLQIGSADQTVTITAEPPQINLENGTVGRTIESQEVVDLPLVDRNAYSLLELVPGVQSNTSGNTLGYPQQVVQINGSTLENNTGSVSYYLDGGLDMTGVRMTGNQMPNPEAISEFNVQTNNYSAAYGRMSSGVVSAVTKSGTNRLHGTLYEYHRETNFNSSPWNSGGVRQPVHRHTYGGVVGGPILRDKAFFFFDYSGFRNQFSTLENNAILPTTKEAAGDFSDYLPTSSGTITSCSQTLSATDKAAGDFIVCNPNTRQPYANNVITDPLDQTALSVIKALPAANAGTSTAPGWVGYVPTPQTYNEYMGKVDENVSSRNHLNGSYFYLNGQNTIRAGSSNLPWGLQLQKYSLHVINLSDTITLNANMIDQTWVTYTRSFGGRVNTPEKWLSDFGSAFVGQGKASLPDISVSNYFHLADAIDGPTAGTNFYSIRHLFIWNTGNHSLSIGGEASLNKDILLTDLNNYGVWSFTSSSTARTGNSLADFVLGLAVSQKQDAPVTALDNSFFYSMFAQDDWHIRRNLTINAGLRWDIQTPPTDPQNKTSTFVAGQLSGINPNAPLGQLFPGDPGVGRGIVAVPYKHFSPRLGFAWDPYGNGKTSVRGAAGIFWGGISGNEWNATSNFYPFTLRYTFGVPGTLSQPYINTPSPFPFSYTPGQVAPAPAGTSLSGVGPDFRWPFTYQVNASVEQQITPSTVVSVGYVATLARALPFEPDINYPVFNTANPTSNTTKNVNNRRPIPSLGSIAELGNGPGGIARANSNYNALQVLFSRRVSKGLSFHGFYTWSKTLSSEGLDSSNVTVEDGYNLALEKGPSNNDQRHIFVTSLVWKPNYFKSNRFAHAVLDGWTVSPIVNISSGTPFTITTGTDNNNDGVSGDRANQTANPYDSTIDHSSRSKAVVRWFDTASFCSYTVANPTACPGTGPAGSDGTSERNGFYGPGSKDVDLALLRDFRISERLTFQLRGESTNVFNFVNLGNPNGAINISATTNQITGAGGMREIQIGGRLTF
jgi:Carboxypeptidase regulatory-like domain